MSEPPPINERDGFRREFIRFGDGTTRRCIYPRGTPLEIPADTDPIFELWRDADDNVIERPNREVYREDIEERRRSPEHKERVRQQAERKGLTVEEYQRYREAWRKYDDVELWKPQPPPRKPQPEDFRGTSP